MKIKPRKSLGQNFLSDKNIIKSIVEIGSVEKNSTILEIGPGTGNLTEFILKKQPKQIIVIEKDYNLSKLLYEKFIVLTDIVKQLPPIFKSFWENLFSCRSYEYGNA